MEPISLIVGAVVLLVGMGLGRAMRVRPPTPTPPNLMCGCDHELSMHDPATNRCHDTERQSRYGPKGAHLGFHDVQCGCRQYTGARPIDQVFLPPTFQADPS